MTGKVRVDVYFSMRFQRPPIQGRWPLEMLKRDVPLIGELPRAFLTQYDERVYTIWLLQTAQGEELTPEQIQRFINQNDLFFPMAWEVLHFTNVLRTFWGHQRRKWEPLPESASVQERLQRRHMVEEYRQLRGMMESARGNALEHQFYCVAPRGHELLGVTPSGVIAGVQVLHATQSPPRSLQRFMALGLY